MRCFTILLLLVILTGCTKNLTGEKSMQVVEQETNQMPTDKASAPAQNPEVFNAIQSTNNRIVSFYIYANGNRIAKKENNALLYYHTDSLSSVRAITNDAGAVIDRQDYTPYGADLHGSKLNNEFSYTGQYDDGDLYYYGARYMDSFTSRFISADPAGISDSSFYSYVENNPLVMVDPDGRITRSQYKQYLKSSFIPLVKEAYKRFSETGQYPAPSENYLITVMPPEGHTDCADFAITAYRLSKNAVGEKPVAMRANNQPQKGKADDVLNNVGAANLLEPSNTFKISKEDADTGDLLITRNKETDNLHTLVFAAKPWTDEKGVMHFAMMYDPGAESGKGMKYMEFTDKKSSFISNAFSRVFHVKNNDYYYNSFFGKNFEQNYRRWNEFKEK